MDENDTIVAVADEPMHHELWRTPTLRVLRADFPARSSCLWHEHVRYTVYICITDVDVMEHKYGCEPVPLRLARGHVLCRDHSAEPLVHRATTKGDRVVLVGVEIQQQSAPKERLEDDLTRIEGTSSECVHSDNRSRVDRLDVIQETVTTVSTTAEAVLAALTDCALVLESEENTSKESQTKNEKIQLRAGSAIPLPQGNYKVTLETPTTAVLFLVQVLG